MFRINSNTVIKPLLILAITYISVTSSSELIFMNDFEQLTTHITAGQDQQVFSSEQVSLVASITPGSEPPISVQWVQIEGSISVDIYHPDSTSAFFIAPWVNSSDKLYKFRVSASFTNQPTIFDEVFITISNDTPQADTGPDQVVLAGSNVILDGSNSQAINGGLLTNYLWEVIQPAGNTINLNGANTSTASFTAPLVSATQVIQLKLTVTESGIQNSKMVNVTVVLDLNFKDFGGSFNGIDVNESLQIAYIAQGEGGLGIYDISDKTNPLLLSFYNTQGNANDVFVLNNIAFVADQFNGLNIIDVTLPTSPILLSIFDTLSQARSVKVRGNYAYVADYSSGLVVLDIADLSNPVQVFEYDTNGRSLDIEISQNGLFAYIADRTSLLVFDLTNPALPILLYSVPTQRDANAIEIRSNTLYLANGNNGLLLFDISNTALEPVLTQTLATSGYVKNAKLFNQYLLLAESTGGISLWDITLPSSPVFKSTFNTSGDVQDVYLFGLDAVVSDGYGGLKIIDFSNFNSPIKKSEVDTIARAFGIGIKDNIAFVVDDKNGLIALEIQNPYKPKKVGVLHFEDAADIEIKGNYAYIANRRLGLRIVDISNASDMVEVSLTALNGNPPIARDIDIQGQYAYIAGNFFGVYVVDILDPSNPTVLGNTNFGTSSSQSQAKSVVTKNNLVYTANGTFGFAIADISIPNNPTKVVTMLPEDFDTTVIRGDGHDVAIQNNYAYFANHGAGLAIIDVANPFLPTIIQEVRGGMNSINSTYIDKHFLFTTNTGDGTRGSGFLLIWDITNPITMQDLPDALYPIGGKFPNIIASGNYLFMAGDSLKVIDISNQLNPHQ